MALEADKTVSLSGHDADKTVALSGHDADKIVSLGRNMAKTTS